MKKKERDHLALQDTSLTNQPHVLFLAICSFIKPGTALLHLCLIHVLHLCLRCYKVYFVTCLSLQKKQRNLIIFTCRLKKLYFCTKKWY